MPPAYAEACVLSEKRRGLSFRTLVLSSFGFFQSDFQPGNLAGHPIKEGSLERQAIVAAERVDLDEVKHLGGEILRSHSAADRRWFGEDQTPDSGGLDCAVGPDGVRLNRPPASLELLGGPPFPSFSAVVLQSADELSVFDLERGEGLDVFSDLFALSPTREA